MVAPFYQTPKMTPEDISPWGNLLSNALSNYKAINEAAYQQPNLKEALLKSQQYNQYYGPEKESEIGLRSAQAGHLGSLTEGQNISNQFSPGKFKDEAQLRKFKLENPGFDAPGITGQIARYLYAKKNGLLPEMGDEQKNDQSFIPPISGGPQEMDQQNANSKSIDPVLQSILNLGKTPKENPDYKRSEDLKSKQELEDYKTDQKIRLDQKKLANKEIQEAKHDRPRLLETEKAIKELIKIADNEKNDELFGHNWFPGYAAKTSENPDMGTWQTLMQGPIAEAEQSLSSRGNQLSLKTALATKASIEEKRPVAKAKLEAMLSKVQDAIKNNNRISGKKSSSNSDNDPLGIR